MPTWTVIAKGSTAPVFIEDLGIEIPQIPSTITLSNFFDYSDIADSLDLINQVQSGDVVINNGSTDLNSTDGLNYIKRDNVYDDLEKHYTKTELSTANTGNLVDWSNVFNVPSFGSPTWTAPASYRVLGVDLSTAPVGPSVGDVYVDDNNNYQKWDGAAWQNIGTVSDGDRVIDLGDTDEPVKTFTGAPTNTWGTGVVVADNTAIMINDDGDEKNAQYVYQTETDNWTKIADVDFDDHLDGGSNKHDASEITIENNYTNLGVTAPASLESVVSSINTQMGEALDNNTLDAAYAQVTGSATPSRGAGRVITVDAGPVEFNASSGNAPFKITPKSSLPTVTGEDGMMAMVSGGLLFVYDGTRNKWLSIQRQYLIFGRRRSTQNQYLNIASGSMPSNNSGYRMIRNATIVGLSAQLDENVGAAQICTIGVRVNDLNSNLSGSILTIPAGSNGTSDSGINVDLNSTDWMQCYLASSAPVQDPVFIVEIAYRL